MKNNRIFNIRLSGSVGWSDNDINFLTTIEFLKGVEIYSPPDIKDLTPLYSLPNLEFLGIDDYIKTDLDFSKLPNLKTCLISWHSKYKNLFKIKTLEHLLINKYPYENLNELSELKNLKTLDITSRKLQSLKGIQVLNKLKSLKLYRCTNLMELTGIEELIDLKVLDIDTCKKISNLNGCQHLKSLEKINLDNCKDIDTLRLLRNCSRLKSIIFTGDINIKDGDFRDLLELPNLNEFWFTEKKHYSLKRDEVSCFLKKSSW